MNFDELVAPLESQARAWIEQDRDNPLEAVLVNWRQGNGWDDLPSYLRSGFSGLCSHYVGQGEKIAVAFRGDRAGWKNLFAQLDRVVSKFFTLKPDFPLDPVCHWVFLLFQLTQKGYVDRSSGGSARNLDPRISITIDGKEIREPRFAIPNDGHPKTRFLRESAETYGYYSHFTDVRIQTIAVIQFVKEQIRSKNEGTAPPPQIDLPTIQTVVAATVATIAKPSRTGREVGDTKAKKK